MKAFLAGPNEDVETILKEGWRANLVPRLLELGIGVLDPTHNCGMDQFGDWQERERKIEQSKKKQDWQAFLEAVQEMWIMNKEGVDAADFVIAYTKVEDRGHGRVREMQEAFEYKKHIFLVVEGDVSKMSTNMLHMVLSKGKIFSSFDELVEYLKKEVVPHPEKYTGHIDLFQIAQKLMIVNDKNELLILKNAHQPYYDMPGGRVDMEEFGDPLERRSIGR